MPMDARAAHMRSPHAAPAQVAAWGLPNPLHYFMLTPTSFFVTICDAAGTMSAASAPAAAESPAGGLRLTFAAPRCGSKSIGDIRLLRLSVSDFLQTVSSSGSPSQAGECLPGVHVREKPWTHAASALHAHCGVGSRRCQDGDAGGVRAATVSTMLVAACA